MFRRSWSGAGLHNIYITAPAHIAATAGGACGPRVAVSELTFPNLGASAFSNATECSLRDQCGMLPCGDPDAVGGDDDAGDTADGNVLDARDACGDDTLYDEAAKACEILYGVDTAVWTDCIFDYCAMGGDAVVVEAREIDARDRREIAREISARSLLRRARDRLSSESAHAARRHRRR